MTNIYQKSGRSSKRHPSLHLALLPVARIACDKLLYTRRVNIYTICKNIINEDHQLYFLCIQICKRSSGLHCIHADDRMNYPTTPIQESREKFLFSMAVPYISNHSQFLLENFSIASLHFALRYFVYNFPPHLCYLFPNPY